jgi:hypothetical protein
MIYVTWQKVMCRGKLELFRERKLQHRKCPELTYEDRILSVPAIYAESPSEFWKSWPGSSTLLSDGKTAGEPRVWSDAAETKMSGAQPLQFLRCTARSA